MNEVIGQLFPEIADIDTASSAAISCPMSRRYPRQSRTSSCNGTRTSATSSRRWRKPAGRWRPSVPRPSPTGGPTSPSSAGSSARRSAPDSFLDWDDALYAEPPRPSRTMPEAKRKRVVFIDSMSGNELVVFGTQEIYYDAGGLTNVVTEVGYTEGAVKVGAEALLAWKPDILFVNYYDDVIKPEDILQHPVLSALDAVKADGSTRRPPSIRRPRPAASSPICGSPRSVTPNSSTPTCARRSSMASGASMAASSLRPSSTRCCRCPGTARAPATPPPLAPSRKKLRRDADHERHRLHHVGRWLATRHL